MANYFMRGAATVAAGQARGRSDMVHVDKMYQLHIHNKAGTVKFSGYVPEDFNISLASNWASPFGGVSLADVPNNRAQNANKALKFAGYSSIHKLASARVWDSPQYLTLELPIFLDAYHSTQEEVMDPMVQLLSMAAPDEWMGFFVPPGPAPAKEVLNAAVDTLTEAVGVTATNEFNLEEAFTVRLGTFFAMTPAIITNVSASGDCAFEDSTGHPIAADFMVTVESYFAVTRKDLQAWFNPQALGNL